MSAPDDRDTDTPHELGASDATKKFEVTGILWLASYPKSGNTWTRNFLHNLLNILENKDASEQDINAMNEFTFWEISAKAYEKFLEKPVTESTREEIAAVRPKVQEMIAQSTDGLAMVKTHHCLVMDRGVPAINLEVTAGAVYIVRNPLDVAISLASHIGGTIDEAIDMMQTRGLETAIGEKNVHEIYGSWSQHVESWTRMAHRGIHVMRYENMLADPFRVFGGLARHLLLRPREDQLRMAIERSSFENLRKQEEASGFKEKPEKAERFFREGNAGQWRDRLDRRQVRKIVAAHHQQMQRFGYLTDDLKHLA
ncbi:MAG TPA: sulfotransferase domain-containing protein [Rhizomicrobium sp.]